MPRITNAQLKEQIEELKAAVARFKHELDLRTDELDSTGRRNLELLGQIEERDADNVLLMTKVGELTLELARQEEGR